jgi:pyridinium-3,5-bisthiocarboxylic acid mononucleotide nickel chelatase
LQHLIHLVFRETTTFGMRLRREERRVLQRKERIAETTYGPVRAKDGFDNQGALLKTHIEFEDVRKIAEERNLPYRTVLERLRKEV